MSGMDRPPGDPDAAPDAPRSEGAVAIADRCAIADAGTRRECALAYRVTVDAVHARTAPAADSRRVGDGDPAAGAEAAKRPDMAERYPDRYARTADPPPQVEGPAEHPAGWVGDIYPGRDRNERPNNCGECARSADSTWHGAPVAAAELASRPTGGERPAVMTEWAGQAPEAASMTGIAQRLRELGPGSSAVVGFDRADAPGHWFNAVNHDGKILAVDGQSALFEDWPPSNDGLGFDENGMSYSDAIYFTPDGKVVHHDHQ